MGTHLRVLSQSYPFNTNVTGFRWSLREATGPIPNPYAAGQVASLGNTQIRKKPEK